MIEIVPPYSFKIDTGHDNVINPHLLIYENKINKNIFMIYCYIDKELDERYTQKYFNGFGLLNDSDEDDDDDDDDDDDYEGCNLKEYNEYNYPRINIILDNAYSWNQITDDEYKNKIRECNLVLEVNKDVIEYNEKSTGDAKNVIDYAILDDIKHSREIRSCQLDFIDYVNLWCKHIKTWNEHIRTCDIKIKFDTRSCCCTFYYIDSDDFMVNGGLHKFEQTYALNCDRYYINNMNNESLVMRCNADNINGDIFTHEYDVLCARANLNPDTIFGCGEYEKILKEVELKLGVKLSNV